MKKLKSLFCAVALFGTTLFAQAQTTVGHIDVSGLVTNMADYKAAEAQLKKIGDTYDAEYKKLVTEYQTKADAYQREAKTAGDALNQTRNEEMQQFGERIQKYQETAGKEIQTKSEDLRKPILEKARLAIQKVARAKKISYVLDSTIGSGVILADGPDLMEDVKKELASSATVVAPVKSK
jgi:outer membrane protein